jgi:hypothetical protein
MEQAEQSGNAPDSAGTSRPRRLRGCLKTMAGAGLLIGAGFLLAAILGEVIIRYAAPLPPVPRWFENSPEYVYRLKKNFSQQYDFPGFDAVMNVRTNALGHRQADWDPGRPFSGTTVLFLGDSFVFGYGVNVEDRFDMLLRKRFPDDAPLRLINAGVPGWGTLQELRYAREHLEIFQPDIIVLVFCGNDPHDDMLYSTGRMVFNEQGIFWFPGKEFLRAHSMLYRFLLRQSRVIRHNLYLWKAGRKEDAPQPDPQTASIIPPEEWEKTRRKIAGFHRDFQAFNPDGRLIVLAAAPWEEDIRDGLAPLGREEALDYLDLHDESRVLPEPDRRLPWDGHWSYAMHELVADRLSELLRPLAAGQTAGRE